MPLFRASSSQVAGHRFYNRRLTAALTTGKVGLEEDPKRAQDIATALSIALALVGVVIMLIASIIKPVGQVGTSLIVRDLDTGALYVRVGETLYPALNLTSARLIANRPDNPEEVKSSALAQYPVGPLVGIPGAPNWSITSPKQDHARWAVCDTTADNPNAAPTVTALAGTLSPEGRTKELAEGQAVLMRYDATTYAVWGSVRSPVDTADRATALAVGVDAATMKTRRMSRALFDAIPATPPLRVPVIPGAGSPSPWPIAPGVVVGSVVQVQDPTGGTEFFVVTEQGVQKISPLVASLIRGANAYGATVTTTVPTDKLTGVPSAHVLDVDYYPQNRLTFTDPATTGVTCVTWDKASGEKRATTAILAGRTLPLTENQQRFVTVLTRDDRNDPQATTANQTWVGPDAAALFRLTSMDPMATSKESLWWLAPNGVRFGVPFDNISIQALGVDISAADQAPWAMVQGYAPGPALTQANAMVKQDTLRPGVAPQPLPKPAN